MAGIIHGFKTFYRTGNDPRLLPNRFVTVALVERLDDSFEVTEREGDTVPEPFHGDDELAGLFITSQQEAKSYFEKRCLELASEGWREYRGE
jgi:hypothetical protein